MKKFLGILAIISIAAISCAKQEDIDNLQKQIDELKSNEIATVQQQVTAINGTLATLQTTDSELRGYISTLQQQESALAQADQALESSISSLRTELSGEINTAKANALAQLDAYKATVSTQLAALRASIDSLKTKDADLQSQITALRRYIDSDLKTYIDNGDNSVKTWASATFATLTQYNATANIVAGIQGDITSINSRLDQISAGVSSAELQQALNALDSDHQTKLNKAVSDCNSAIETAKSEITAAYTTAIANAISSSERSMRTWVNNQLSGYYTIAQTDAKISSLKTNLEGQLSSQKTQLQTLISSLEATLDLKIKNNADDIEECRGLIDNCNTLISQNAQAISANTTAISKLRTDLNTARTDITAAYQQAINTAITTLDGQLRGQIATEVATINSRIDDEVTAINATITALTTRVETCERDIRNIKNTIYAMQQDIEDLQDQVAAILARIQSISFVPAYSDGKVPVSYTDNGTLTPGTASFDFKLQPASTAADLAQVWQTALKVEAVYTITKSAPEFVQLTITSATADNGYLTVTVSGAALKEDFFRSRCSANATLTISDGNNELASEYIPLVPWTTDVISFGDPAFKAYCVENFDTSGDGEISEDEAEAVTSINASMLNITSLVGIEYFSNLESIDVSFNKLETLDLSHSTKLESVLVNGNKLQTLNLSGLADMTELDCSNNKLTALNVSEAEGLLTLNCSNNQIGALNVKKNKTLTELQCSNNQIAALDLKNNTALESLYCRKNSISVLDVTKLTALKNFDCSNNNLTSLNLYLNSLLENLYCANNSLTALSVAANTALTVLDCSGNALTVLDVSKNAALETLTCSNNTLSSLDVSRNAALASVDCRGNADLAKLWVKDAAQQSALTVRKEDATQIAFNDGGIYIPDTNLKNYLLALFDDDEDGEISIVEAENVQNVNCSGRSISDLTGLQDCPNLKYLNFNGNSVSSVDLPNLSKLETIVAYGNPIERLVINNDNALSALYLQDVNTNALSDTTVTINAYDQAATLYLAFAGTKFTELNLTNSSTLTAYDISENVQLTKLVASGNSLVTGVNVSTLTALEHLDVRRCNLNTLDVDTNVNLVYLAFSTNQLSSINLDNNILLKTLGAAENQLTTIRLTNNTLLEKIYLQNNQLQNVNVRKNTSMKDLDVSGNAGITALALGYNPSLEILHAGSTGLSDIDLSSNLVIKTLDLGGCSGISIIDLSVNTNLTNLNVSSTSIAALDVTNNTSLSTLSFNNGVYLTVGNTIKPISSVTAKWAYVDNVKSVFFKYGGKIKALSIDQASKYWNDGNGNYNDGGTSFTDGMANTNIILSKSEAAKWCRAKGSSWYLPARDELVSIYNNKSNLNSTLSTIGGTQFSSSVSGSQYWSSTRNENSGYSHEAYYIDFSSGKAYKTNKQNIYKVRAIRAL